MLRFQLESEKYPRNRQGGLLLRGLEDRSAPCALEVDDHTNRRVHKSVLLLVVQAGQGAFPRCARQEFLEGSGHFFRGSFDGPFAIVPRVLAKQKHTNRVFSTIWPFCLLLNEYAPFLGLYTRTRKSWDLALLFASLPSGDIGCSGVLAMVADA